MMNNTSILRESRKVHKQEVKDTLKYTHNAEDAENKPIIYKTKDADHADIQTKESENIIGN